MPHEYYPVPQNRVKDHGENIAWKATYKMDKPHFPDLPGAADDEANDSAPLIVPVRQVIELDGTPDEEYPEPGNDYISLHIIPTRVTITDIIGFHYSANKHHMPRHI